MCDRINLMLWYWGRRGFPVRWSDDLLDRFAKREDVGLTVSFSRQSEGFDTRSPFQCSGYHVDTFNSAAGIPAAMLRLPRQRRELANFARAHNIDVVFALMRHPFSPWALSSLRHKDRRVLLAVHDALPHPGDSFFLWHQLFYRDLKATDGIMVMSEAVLETMVRVYNYPKDRTFLLPLTAPDTGQHRSPRTAPEGRPWRLIFFGRILEYKGLDLLSVAYAILRERFSVSLRIVGSGYVPALDSLAQLPDVTIEQGWIPETQVDAMFDHADILVLPYTEASQSGVFASAQAAGVPTVATPVGGLIEQVRPGVGGTIAQEVTPQSFANAIAMLLSDSALYARCSAGALEAASTTHHTDRAVEAIVRASRVVLNLPPRS